MVTMGSLGPFVPKRISGRVSQVNGLLSFALFLLQQSRTNLVTSKLMHSVSLDGDSDIFSSVVLDHYSPFHFQHF